MDNFETLFKVKFNHTYYTDLSFRGFEVSPMPTCITYLNRRDLTFKPANDSFSIILNTGENESQSKKDALFADNFVLNFTLTLTDQNLYNYTANLPSEISNTLFYFKNLPDDKGNKPYKQKLHLHEYVSTDDSVSVVSLPDMFFKKPFAIISIALNQSLSAEYSIDFSVRNTIWKYILISDYFKELNNLAIATGTQISFSGPKKVNLPDASSVICFQSETPIPLSQKNNYKFQLIDKHPTIPGKHKVVKRALPMPDPKYISCLPGSSTSDFFYSEMYIN